MPQGPQPLLRCRFASAIGIPWPRNTPACRDGRTLFLALRAMENLGHGNNPDETPGVGGLQPDLSGDFDRRSIDADESPRLRFPTATRMKVELIRQERNPLAPAPGTRPAPSLRASRPMVAKASPNLRRTAGRISTSGLPLAVSQSRSRRIFDKLVAPPPGEGIRTSIACSSDRPSTSLRDRVEFHATTPVSRMALASEAKYPAKFIKIDRT